MNTVRQPTKAERFISRHWNVVSVCLISVMAAMICVSFIMMFVNEVSSDQTVLSGCIIQMICMMFAFVLGLCCCFGTFELNRIDFYFFLMLTSAYLVSFFNLTGLTCTGKPEYTGYVIFAANAYYIISALFWIPFWLYIAESLPKNKSYSFHTVILCAFIITYEILVVINNFVPIFYRIENDTFITSDWDVISMIYIFLIVAFMTVVILVSRSPAKTKLMLFSYVIFPIITLVFSFCLSLAGKRVDVDIITVMRLLPLYIIFFNDYVKQRNEYYRQNAENTQIKTALMLSQIQPHFLYNSLASISEICYQNNDIKAKTAIDMFSQYLRVNLDSIKAEKYVRFDKELDHIKTYVWLEKLRFGNDLNVEYDIKYDDFSVPSLTVQPLIENAIKHGICKSENGGTVFISTEKTDDEVIISVIDNGVGFDVKKRPPDDGRSHVGIENIASRLKALCGGKLTIRSQIGVGTVAKITIPLNENVYFNE